MSGDSLQWKTIMSKFSILVIDDERLYCEVMDEILRGRGYEVWTACDVPQALVILERCLPNLILLDVMMPKYDGYSLARELRSEPRFTDIPVVIVTARATPDSHMEAICSGASGFLQKPFTVDELHNTIKPFLTSYEGGQPSTI
jgi:CheY-like chemotaxis protein